MTVDNEINGSLLKIKRESLGWTLADMAARACLSTKQVKQLEEGGDNSFYSHAIKLTVAKKIAQILQVSEDDLFYRAPVVSPSNETDDQSLEIENIIQSSIHANSIHAEKVGESEDPAKKSGLVSEPTEVQASVSFASILTRSQSSSDDLDALLAQDESSVALTTSGGLEIKDHPSDSVHSGAVSMSPQPVGESSHSETVGLPSTPSPITLSSASSSLSEDQHTNEQSVWVKVILGVLVLMGALLIVAPKSFDGVAEMLEGGLKKADAPVDASPNPNSTLPAQVPALDASQNDTPVEVGKSNVTNSNAVEVSKPPSAVTPVLPSAPIQPNNVTLPTTAVPSSNPSLGNAVPSTTQKVQPQPLASPTSGQ